MGQYMNYNTELGIKIPKKGVELLEWSTYPERSIDHTPWESICIFFLSILSLSSVVKAHNAVVLS